MSVGIGPQRNDISTNSKQESMDSNQKPKSFYKMNCIKNIRYLVEKQNLKIGELEKASGNSIGYLSRLEKQEKSADPSAELLVTAAKMLGVTLDELVFDKLEDLSANEESVLTFIKKITENTKKDRVNWDKETIEQHIKFENTDPCMECPHPMYKIVEEEINGFVKIPVGWKYNSLFYPDERVKIIGNSYYACINKNDDFIYLMACDYYNEDAQEKTFYEIYHITAEKEVLPICSTLDTNKRIVEAVEILINSIIESRGKIHLSQKTKILFDTYE